MSSRRLNRMKTKSDRSNLFGLELREAQIWVGVRSEDPGGGALASAAVFSIASITGRARDNPRPSYSVETRRSKIRIGPERKLEPVWVGKGEGGEGRRLADFKGLRRVRRGERSLICRHLSFPSLRWKSDPYLWLPGARRAPPGPPLAPLVLGLPPAMATERWAAPEPGPAPCRVGDPTNPSRTNLASPRPPPGAEPLGSVRGAGACSRHCSWEPTLTGYLPNLASPDTQFLFLRGAVSLFSATFRGQGSPGPRQRFSRGRNSFETWLSTLVVPRMGRIHYSVSGSQLREKQSHTPLSRQRG